MTSFLSCKQVVLIFITLYFFYYLNNDCGFQQAIIAIVTLIPLPIQLCQITKTQIPIQTIIKVKYIILQVISHCQTLMPNIQQNTAVAERM